MNDKNEIDEPAFPYIADANTMFHYSSTGMSLRAYAAIKLKQPDSGIDWLDEMIRKARIDEIATKAMQAGHSNRGFNNLCGQEIAKWAYKQASFMEEEKKKSI